MFIRDIADADIPAIAKLMRSISAEFITHESSVEAAATFMRENDEAGLRGFLQAGIVYHVAERDGAIVGFIAVRDRQHLYHMFVDKAHHRQGIARALWRHARAAALEAGGTGVFTVNSSNFALPVYEALGFMRTAPMQCAKGLYYNPMTLDGSGNE